MERAKGAIVNYAVNCKKNGFSVNIFCTVGFYFITTTVTKKLIIIIIGGRFLYHENHKNLKKQKAK